MAPHSPRGRRHQPSERSGALEGRGPGEDHSECTRTCTCTHLPYSHSLPLTVGTRTCCFSHTSGVRHSLCSSADWPV